MRYKNTTGDCTGLAIATAINKRFNVEIPHEAVEDFYARHDWTVRGARMINALETLKEDNLFGYKVNNYKLTFHDGSSKNPAKEVRMAMGHPHTDLLMEMWIRKRRAGKSKIPLDDLFYYAPQGEIDFKSHALFVDSYDFMEDRHVPLGIRLVNNWGQEWGLGGDFFMTFQQMHTEVCQLFEVEFIKVNV